MADEVNTVKESVENLAITSPDNDLSEEEEQPVREITQTDHLNKRLLSAFLDKINQDVRTPAEEEDNDAEWQEETREPVEEDQPDLIILKCNMGGKVIVVGISGTTNSGKSTLSCRLVRELANSRRVCQDHYFLPPGDPRLAPLYLPDLDHNNWEDHRALEMDRLVEDVKAMIAEAEQNNRDNNVILFVEGFSIFTYRPLEVLLDKKYCITVDRDLCWKRRQTRNYNPPDKPGYFDQVVWPMWQAHLKQLQDQDDIVYYDGNSGVDDLFKRICDDLEQHSAKQNSTS